MRYALKRLFVRKQRLPRGLVIRKTDPEARWLIKHAEQYTSDHRKITKRLKANERAREWGIVSDTISGLIFLLAFMILLFLSYLYIMPTSMIGQVFSPQGAAWVDDLRKSGCARSYARYVLFFPVVKKQTAHALELNIRLCISKNMLRHS